MIHNMLNIKLIELGYTDYRAVCVNKKKGKINHKIHHNCNKIQVKKEDIKTFENISLKKSRIKLKSFITILNHMFM